MKVTSCSVTPEFAFHAAFSTMSFVTAAVKLYGTPSSIHPWKVKPSFFGAVGSSTASPSFTVNDCTSEPSANFPPSAMKVTVCSFTLGSLFFHCAFSTISFVTAVMKSYASPFSVHPWRVKPSLMGSSFGRGTLFPSCTVNTITSDPSANLPPSAMKVTVRSVTPGFTCHFALSTMLSVTVSVEKLYPTPLSVHSWKVKPSLAGFGTGCCAFAPFCNFCTAGCGSPPSVMKCTVHHDDAFSSHCATSSILLVTGSVKSYSAPLSFHPMKA